MCMPEGIIGGATELVKWLDLTQVPKMSQPEVPTMVHTVYKRD